MILTKFEDICIPIKEIHKNLQYKNIEGKNKINIIISKKKLIHEFDDDIDNCILYALNYYDNLNNFVIFGYDKSTSFNYYNDVFKNDYSLYGIKYLKLSTNILTKIMYQLLFSRMIIKTKQDLEQYIETNYRYLHKYDKEFIDITILVLCKRDLNKKYPTFDISENDHVVYIPNTKESIWNCASVFFSSSTLYFLEKQNFDYFLTKHMETSKKMFLQYRSWLNNNIEHKYQQQFILYSSIVLYLLGHRSMNDLDLYIHTIPENIQELTKELSNNELYNKYIEYNIKNTDKWPDYWNSWLDEWAKKCGAKYFEEILGNPKYHFYFLGVKIISIHCDIVRRIERNRPRAIADLIALRKRYQFQISIPYIPEKYNKYISIKNLSQDEINKYIQDGNILNDKNKEISIECKNNIDKFIETIIWALNTRYRMTFTVNEIKRELNMLDREKSVDTVKKIKIVTKRK
jgi:hypothetical protein